MQFSLKTLTILIWFHSLPNFLEGQLLSSKSEYSRFDTLLGAITPLRSYNALHYNILMDVDLDKRKICGQVDMKFKCTEDMKRMQVDLYKRYKVKNIWLNGKAVKYTRDSNFIFIDLKEGLVKGQDYVLRTSYEGKPIEAIRAPWDGGFDWKKDKEGNHWVGVACEGMGGSTWWPCKDHWSDEPEEGVLFTALVPKPYQVVSNGRFVRSFDTAKKVAYTWQVKNPINIYNVTMNIGVYAHWDTAYVSKENGKTLDINYWVLKSNEAKARKQFEQVYPMMECFESKFGSYPFYEDGYMLVETPYLGMEHQSCVAYGNDYQSGYKGDLKMTGGHDFDYIIIHETGHEWFGNNITAADNADMWIHEAFTTYSESIYVECMYGKTAGANYCQKMKRRIGNKEPIVGPYHVAKEGSGDMYAKGAVFLHNLRMQLNNDEVWYQFLKEINQKFRHQVTNYDEVLAFFNEKTGRKWDAMFQHYLKEKDLPTLLISKDAEQKKIKLELRTSSNIALDLNQPVKIDGVQKSVTISSTKPTEISYTSSAEVIEDLLLRYKEKKKAVE